MKLIKKPNQDDVDFFGYIPAFIFANTGIVILIVIIISLLAWLVIFSMIDNGLEYIKNEGLKNILETYWNGKS